MLEVSMCRVLMKEDMFIESSMKSVIGHEYAVTFHPVKMQTAFSCDVFLWGLALIRMTRV